MSVRRSPGFPLGVRGLAVAGLVICVVLVVAAGLWSRSTEEPAASALDVGPLAFEARGAGRNIDAPCFWTNPRDPAGSLLFVTAKDSRVVEIFRAATGARVGEIAGFKRPNNCAVEGDMLLTTDAGAPEVTMHHLPDLELVGSFGTDMLSPQGIDVLSTPEGQSLVYVTDSADASVHVYDLDGGAPVRTFPTGFGEGIEPILADDRYQRIFVARGEKEEARGIGVFTPEGTLVREFGGAIFSADTEGLGIYACGAGGYLLAADQNRSATEIEVFERESLTHLGTFRLRNAAGAATRATDGIALLQTPLPGYASGLLAVCDGCGSTPRDEMDVVGWDQVAAVMGLERCPGGGAPDCTTAPCARRVVATADAFVTHEAPLTNFGKAATLEVERKPGQIMETLLRFEVPELAGVEVLGARLRLTVDPRKGADSDGGGRLFRTTDKWTEEDVTFAKRPGAVGPVVSMIGRVRRDEPVDLDVSKVVRGAGRYDFLLVANSKNRVRYRSREAADSPPTLVLTLRARTEAVAPVPDGDAHAALVDAVADAPTVEAATRP
ncbi:MAG: phytase [Deltaproteobacteria bacterium]|nr:phytase [Deltaproteobacteria bacterium]